MLKDLVAFIGDDVNQQGIDLCKLGDGGLFIIDITEEEANVYIPYPEISHIKRVESYKRTPLILIYTKFQNEPFVFGGFKND